MSDEYEREREYRNVQYSGVVYSEEIGGFSFETGRKPDKGSITEKAVAPGDLVWIIVDGRDTVYRAVEVGEGGVLAYNKENDSMELELLEWGEITSKIDPHSYYIDCHDEYPDEIKMVKDPSDD